MRIGGERKKRGSEMIESDRQGERKKKRAYWRREKEEKRERMREKKERFGV